MAKDTACADLSNLLWDEIDPVEVPIDDTFLPYTDFRRGQKSGNGIGPVSKKNTTIKTISSFLKKTKKKKNKQPMPGND